MEAETSGSPSLTAQAFEPSEQIQASERLCLTNPDGWLLRNETLETVLWFPDAHACKHTHLNLERESSHGPQRNEPNASPLRTVLHTCFPTPGVAPGTLYFGFQLLSWAALSRK